MVVHRDFLIEIWEMTSRTGDNNLLQLKKTIEEALDWGPSDSWHSKMFDELSDKVFQQTHVMLSPATLKRFFGVVKHEGAPSITTLDVLSQFVGRENWREFKLQDKPKRRIITPRKSVYVTLGFILSLITIGLIGNKRPEIIIDASEFSFSSNVLSSEFPNSVVFNFEIPTKLRSDSLVIQQFWDPTKTIRISKEQTRATGIYYFPGYFRAKLMVEGTSVSEHDLFLKSEGWLGSIEYEPVPKYFVPQQDESGLTFPVEIMEEVEDSELPLVSVFHFIDDLGDISGDNFSFSTTIRNTFDDRWAVCQALRIYFIGTKGAMIIPFSKIGCSSDNDLLLNDVFLSGKKNDLSALSADFSDQVNLEIQVSDKNLNLFINKDKVYSDSYHETMGSLVGLRFKFIGLGEVLKMDLRNHNDLLIDEINPL